MDEPINDEDMADLVCRAMSQDDRSLNSLLRTLTTDQLRTVADAAHRLNQAAENHLW